MARTNKEIQKEIEELREIDRITTIKINQEFSDLEKVSRTRQEKEKAKLNDLFDFFFQSQVKTIKLLNNK
jgi:acetyl-CoA carboxylase alpha subunit